MPVTVISAAAQLVAMGIPLATTIIDAVTAEMKLSGSPAPPTAAEQAVIDAGLAAAHAALQAAQQAP
jgi:hypothetical protein